MDNIKIGFIGLGNVGGKLAGSLARHGLDLTVRDLNVQLEADFVRRGATRAASPREMAARVDVIITCLPSPAACAQVVEGTDGILAGLTPGKVWLEMSTTDAAEVRRLGALVEARGAMVMDCPVSGGCHRAATGNVSIFAGGSRAAFERVLPILTILGRRILHTGPLGSASILKVVTNYLCTVHLAALAEALSVSKVAGMDMNTTYEAIRISSGNSFVHETESQVILNGSRDISFTMDLVIKDVGLFDALAQFAARASRALAAGARDFQGRRSGATVRGSSRPTSSGGSRTPAASACWVRVSHRRWSMRSPKRRATSSCLIARAAARRDRTSWPGRAQELRCELRRRVRSCSSLSAERRPRRHETPYWSSSAALPRRADC